MSTINPQGPDIAGIINLNKQQALLGVFDEEQPMRIEDQEEPQSIQLEVPPMSPKAEVEQEHEIVAEVAAVEEASVVENEVKGSEDVNQEVEEVAEPEQEVAKISTEGAVGGEDGAVKDKDEDAGEPEVVPKGAIKVDEEVRI